MQVLLFLAQDREWERVPLRCRLLRKLQRLGHRYCFILWKCHRSVWRQKYLNRAIHMRYPNSSLTADWFLREEKQYRKTERLEAGRKRWEKRSAAVFDKMYIKRA